MVVRVNNEGCIVRLDHLSAMPAEFYFKQKAADMQGSPPEPIVLGSEAVEILDIFTLNAGGKERGS